MRHKICVYILQNMCLDIYAYPIYTSKRKHMCEIIIKDNCIHKSL